MFEDHAMKTQYCACCIDDEEIYYYGLGDSPDEAYSDFVSKGDFDEECNNLGIAEGSKIEVFIYTTIDPKHSDWPADEVPEHWEWCLDKKVETRIATAPAQP